MRDLAHATREIKFNWKRTRLFDHIVALALYELTVDAGHARVMSTEGRRTSKYKPKPLHTVELQKRAAKFCRLGAEQTMEAAEKLYQQGIITYPRTETDLFKPEEDVRSYVEEFRGNSVFGAYATKLLDGGKYRPPRNGTHTDNAHSPITPRTSKDPKDIGDDAQRKVYELIVKHFLAVCSEDALGQQTVITVEMGTEVFSARGLMVQEENWLEIYKPYEYWSAGAGTLPNLQVSLIAVRCGWGGAQCDVGKNAYLRFVYQRKQ